MTRRAALLAAVLSFSGTAYAQGFAGTWTAKDVTVTLTQEEDQVSGTIATDRKNISFAGVAEGNQAFGEVVGPNGSMPFTLTLTGQAMKFEMTPPEGKGLTFFLKRSKAGAPPPTNAAPTPPAPPEPAALPGKAPVPPAGKGGQWKNENEGWSLNSPAGWKGSQQKDGSILLGHDSEFGILRIAHMLGTKLEEARAQGENGFTLEGVMFTLTAPFAPLRVKAGPAIAGTYEGQTMKGPFRVRSVVLQGQNGTLVLSGMAPVSNYGKMTQNVDSMAASVTFFKGTAGNAMQHVAGRWWHWHGSSSGTYTSVGSASSFSSEKKLWLCRDGRFSRAGEFSASASSRTTQSVAGIDGHGTSGSDGRWTAVGTPQAGKIIVTLDNGAREELPYQAGVQGDKFEMYIDGVGYYRKDDIGGCN